MHFSCGYFLASQVIQCLFPKLKISQHMPKSRSITINNELALILAEDTGKFGALNSREKITLHIQMTLLNNDMNYITYCI